MSRAAMERRVMMLMEDELLLTSEPPRPMAWWRRAFGRSCHICRCTDRPQMLAAVGYPGAYGETHWYYVHLVCVESALRYPEGWGHERVDRALVAAERITEQHRDNEKRKLRIATTLAKLKSES